MDGVSDCLDNSDECPKNSEDIFSSNYHLIGNGIFRVILWILAIVAVISNMVIYLIYCKSITLTDGAIFLEGGARSKVDTCHV